VTMSNDLERRYRRLLRAYPRRWRAERGEELLAVLLAEAADSGRCRPSQAEVVDLALNGLTARGREAMRPFSAKLRARVAALSLAGGAALAAVCLACGELSLIKGPVPAVSYRSMATFGPFLTLGALLYLGWLAVLLLTAAGRLRPSANTGLVLLLLSGGVAASSITARSHPVAAAPVYVPLLFAALSVPFCLGRVELTRAGRRRLAAGSAVLGGALVWVAAPRAGQEAFGTEDPRWVFYRGWGHGIQLISRDTWILVLIALTAAALVSRRRPGWFTAVLVAALPWLLFGLLFFDGRNTPHLRLPALSLAGLVGTAVLVAVHHARTHARPSTPYRAG